MDNYINLTSGSEYQDENGQSNYCTSYACSQAVEALFRRVYGKVTPLSNTFAIMNSKKTDRRPDATGTPIENIMKEICKHGIAPLELYPDNVDNNVTDNKFPTPSKKAIEEAKKFRPTGYKKLNTVKEIDEAIEKWGSVIWIVRVYSSHMTPDNGFISLPKKGSSSNGIHAIYNSGKCDIERFMNNRMEKDFYILDETYRRGYKQHLYVPKRYITDKVTSNYSYETYVKECWCFTYDGEMPYQNINDGNEVPIPRNEIVMTVGSSKAIHNGVEKTITPPQVHNSRTYLGVRSVGELLDCAVRWYPDTKKVTIYSKALQMNIEMKIGSKKCIINDTINGTREIELLAEPICVNGSTLLPVRDIGTLFRLNTNYDSKTKQVRLDGLL